MSVFRLKVEVPKGRLFGGQLDRMKDLSPITSKWPQMIRFGPGSLDEQIRQRTHFTRGGGKVPWQEPAHAAGARSGGRVAQLEDVMWQSVRGGVGSITGSTKFGATVGVNDVSVRIRSAELGNRIVSTASYFGFVTGEFEERTGPALAKAVKPTKKGKGEFPRNKAMYWFLLLVMGYKASADELSTGLSVPPKNMGFNPTMTDRIKLMVQRYIVEGVA